MLAGQTNIRVGTRVKIKGITNKDDKYLNGMTGSVTHPFAFGCTKKGWIGIYLDNTNPDMKYAQCNVKTSEIEIIE